MKGVDFFYNNGDIEIDNFLDFCIMRGKMFEKMPMITIYDKLTDYPKKYVARLFLVSKGIVENMKYIVLADTVAELEAKMPIDMIFMPRQANDDPKIVGVYL